MKGIQKTGRLSRLILAAILCLCVITMTVPVLGAASYLEVLPEGAASSSSASEAPTIPTLTANSSEAESASADVSSVSDVPEASSLPAPITAQTEVANSALDLPTTGGPFDNAILVMATGFFLLTTGILLFRRKEEK